MLEAPSHETVTVHLHDPPTHRKDAMAKPLIDQLVDCFLACPLPQSVRADSCACNPNYPHQRTGTNLLTATEAKEVLAKVLEGCSITLN